MARSVVLLAAAPLLRDREVLVQDERRDVVQVLLLHGPHLREEVRAPDGRVGLGDVPQAIIGRGVVEVVHDTIDGVAARQRTRQLLHRQANVLVRAGAAADVADGAGRVEETLAAHKLLLRQVHGLALAVHGDHHVLDVRAGRARGDKHDGTEHTAREEARRGAPERGGLLHSRSRTGRQGSNGGRPLLRLLRGAARRHEGTAQTRQQAGGCQAAGHDTSRHDFKKRRLTQKGSA
mmetsp:Transcript_44138/g.116678  ORF Transcript_44138/g.116678 Transcript_44138/m.116678 type:complete len:235 (+) Transcript_44138:90-794(+)